MCSGCGFKGDVSLKQMIICKPSGNQKIRDGQENFIQDGYSACCTKVMCIAEIGVKEELKTVVGSV